MTFSEILNTALTPILFILVYSIASYVIAGEPLTMQYTASVLITYIATTIIFKYTSK